MELSWPDDPCTLVDDAVVLRPWVPADRGSMVRACNDPEIARWTTVPKPYTDADASTFIDLGRALWAAREAMCFAVDATVGPDPGAPGTDTSTSGDAMELIGSISVVDVSADLAVAEIGYWTAPWARRRGLTSSALELLSVWLLDHVGFADLELVIDPANVGSIGVARRCGYRECQSTATVRPLPAGHVVWRRGT